MLEFVGDLLVFRPGVHGSGARFRACAGLIGLWELVSIGRNAYSK